MQGKRTLTDALKFSILQEASGVFLTETIPDEWDEMSDEEQDKYLTEHAWEPFKQAEAQCIWESINDHAHSLELFLINEKLVEATQ